jgi:hypothetical protein
MSFINDAMGAHHFTIRRLINVMDMIGGSAITQYWQLSGNTLQQGIAFPYVDISQQSVPSIHKYIEHRYGYGNHELDGRQTKTDKEGASLTKNNVGCDEVRALIPIGADIMVDDCSRVILEGVNVFDAQYKLRESEFLRQGISIRDVIQTIHEPVHFNVFLLEDRK